MKYLIRSIKYFIYFSLMCTVIVSALVLIGAVDGDINAIFEDGYASIGKIAIFFALVAAVYPKVAFIQRGISSDKEWSEIRTEVIEYMKEHQWELEGESDGVATFRVRGTAARISKMYEDRITLTRYAGGYQMEGLRKDVMRLATGLEHRLDPQS